MALRAAVTRPPRPLRPFCTGKEGRTFPCPFCDEAVELEIRWLKFL